MPQWLNDYLQELSPAEYNFFTLVLFILLLFCIFQIYRIYKRYRYIQDTATSYISSAAQGYVELKGIAELMPGSQIISPFSQRRCIWYQCKVDIKQTTGKRTHWVEESNEISDEIFLLQDESGECAVIPDGAMVIPSSQQVWYGSNLQASNNHIASGFISRFIGSGNYRFTEKLILVADPVYILGDFISVEKNVNPQTLKQYQQSSIHTIKKPVESNQPFIISTVSEEELLKKKRINLILYLVLFFTLLIIFITMINFPK